VPFHFFGGRICVGEFFLFSWHGRDGCAELKLIIVARAIIIIMNGITTMIIINVVR
jgi:hypothetical protein